MTGLVGVMKKHSKLTHAHAKATETPQAPPVPVGVEMQPCMQKVCEKLRLNERSRTALIEYDATTLEDLAYMTNRDYENMLATAARQNRPLCPLQQRKIVVLIWWVRNLVKESRPFKETQKKPKKPDFWTRLVHSPAELNNMIHPHKPDDDAKSVDTVSIIPPNWEAQFDEDMPMLKVKLKQVGETSSFSIYSDLFINARWVLCGFEH